MNQDVIRCIAEFSDADTLLSIIDVNVEYTQVCMDNMRLNDEALSRIIESKDDDKFLKYISIFHDEINVMNHEHFMMCRSIEPYNFYTRHHAYNQKEFIKNLIHNYSVNDLKFIDHVMNDVKGNNDSIATCILLSNNFDIIEMFLKKVKLYNITCKISINFLEDNIINLILIYSRRFSTEFFSKFIDPCPIKEYKKSFCNETLSKVFNEVYHRQIYIDLCIIGKYEYDNMKHIIDNVPFLFDYYDVVYMPILLWTYLVSNDTYLYIYPSDISRFLAYGMDEHIQVTLDKSDNQFILDLSRVNHVSRSMLQKIHDKQRLSIRFDDVVKQPPHIIEFIKPYMNPCPSNDFIQRCISVGMMDLLDQCDLSTCIPGQNDIIDIMLKST